jgi:flavin-binding protein dodecin
MGGHERSGGVVKVVELVGSSSVSFSDAVRTAVKTASLSLRNIQGVDVLGSSASVGEDGAITRYKVDCKVAFLVEESGSEPESRDEAKRGVEGSDASRGQTTHPADDSPPGITAETIPAVEDGRQD